VDLLIVRDLLSINSRKGRIVLAKILRTILGKSSGELIPVNKPPSAKVKRFAVLGRGTSVLRFPQSGDVYDAVILCNFRDSDFDNSDLARVLQGFELIILGNATEPYFGWRYWRHLNIRQVFWAGFRDTPGRRRSSQNLDLLGLRVDFLPAWLDRDVVETAGNTGLLGVELAANCAGVVDVFGIDFYSGGYLSGSLEATIPWEAEALVKASNGLRERFREIEARHKNVKFSLH